MIDFKNTEVFNFEGAIRGMRNPMNSHHKSDSYYDIEEDPSPVNPNDWVIYRIGENDLNLAHRLIKAGSDHAKFLRQIIVSVDITAPLYWWKEFDTYKVGTVANSTSTMHKIHTKDLTLNDFSTEHLNEGSLFILKNLIYHLNAYRSDFVESKDKDSWWQIIQLLPTSYNQMRTVTLSYQNLRNIYNSRRNHKLNEWSKGFMEWIDSLPYANELIKYGIGGDE